MIIIWGRHASTKSFGTTRHFCPMCRNVCVGTLQHHVVMPHLYYIPLWRQVTPLLTCHSCRLEQRVPKKLRPVREDDEDLLERVVLEEKLKAGRLDWEQRKKLIAEPIAAMEFECTLLAQQGGDNTVLSVMQVFSIIGILGSVITGYMYFNETRPQSKAEFLPWFIGFVAGTVVAIGLAIFVATRSHAGTARDLMAPRIARALAQVRPKHGELEEVLSDMRRKRNKIARALTADDIWGEMV